MIKNLYFNQKEIDNYFPEATMIPPMLVNHIPSGKESVLSSLCASGDYFGQLKKDGYCYIFNKTKNHSYLFSRNVSRVNGLLTEKIANVPHIKEALNFLPENTLLVGEIYYPGKTSKDVTTIMGCLPEEGRKRQETAGLIHFYIHDIIAYKGISLLKVDALTRYKILEKIIQPALKEKFIELAKIELDNLEEKIYKALNSGEEGMVLKDKKGTYQPGKRPAWIQLKIKKVDYAEVIVTDFCEPTKEYNGKELATWNYHILEDGSKIEGSYSELKNKGYNITPVTKPYFYGWKTAIKISAFDLNGNLVPIGTISSGLTDELRIGFAEDPESYRGRVASIQCMSLDKKEHTIRHGFFKGFRDDKDAKDCILENIFS